MYNNGSIEKKKKKKNELENMKILNFALFSNILLFEKCSEQKEE